MEARLLFRLFFISVLYLAVHGSNVQNFEENSESLNEFRSFPAFSNTYATLFPPGIARWPLKEERVQHLNDKEGGNLVYPRIGFISPQPSVDSLPSPIKRVTKSGLFDPIYYVGRDKSETENEKPVPVVVVVEPIAQGPRAPGQRFLTSALTFSGK